MTITMRAATTNDIEFLTQVFLESMCEHITNARGWWDESQETNQFLRQLDIGATRIVERHGVAMGFVTSPRLLTDVQIHTFCVSPEYQGRGIGTAIVATVVQESIARGMGVVISVLKVNTRARAFYERLGFEVVNESDEHFHMRCVNTAAIPAARLAVRARAASTSGKAGSNASGTTS